MLTRIKNEMFSVANWDFEIFQDEDGNYSFHGATVCDYFEIKNPSVAIQRNVDEEWRFKAPIELGKGSDSWMIREPGLYQLAMIAKTPLAKRFQKWVYSEILPKLRAEGGYIMPTASSEQLQALQSQIQEQQEKISLLEDVQLEKRLVHEFLSERIRYKSGSFLRLDEVLIKFRGWSKVRWTKLENMELQEFIIHVDSWTKTLPGILNQRPCIHKENYLELENARYRRQSFTSTIFPYIKGKVGE